MSAGIEILKTSIRIWWKIDGKRQRETLHNTPPTPQNIQKAQAIANMIDQQIKMGIFDKNQTFPNSPKRPENYFGYYITIWQTNEKHNIAPSTWHTYQNKVENHIRHYWQKKKIADIKAEHLEQWVNQTLLKKLSPKTVKDIIMLWRAIWTYWARHQKNITDPTQYIKIKNKDSEDINPFDKQEIHKIINKETDPYLKNLWTVLLWTGLSTHELLPLAIEDIDLNNGCLYIKRGFVKNNHRVTKNRRRKRQVELLPIVIEALKSQIQLAKNNPSQKINILERDNITKKTHKLTWLWYNHQKNHHINYEQLRKTWEKHLKNINIPYRPPNHGRHTYASQVLSTGAITAEWLANQLGHTSTDMIHKHYGKFIPKDSKHIINILDQAINPQ